MTPKNSVDEELSSMPQGTPAAQELREETRQEPRPLDADTARKLQEARKKHAGHRAPKDMPQANDEDLVNIHKKALKAFLAIVITCVALIVLIFAAANTGTLQVSPSQMFNGLFVAYDANVSTIFDLRFPRIVISILAGAAIAVSGVLFQAVLKNPLADPGIIGISNGAGFVAVLVVAFAPQLYFLSPILSCIGGFIAFALVYSLSWKGGLSPLRIILVGVAVAAMFGGLSSAFGSTMSGSSTVTSIVDGNITQKTWDDVGTLFPYVLVGLALSILCVRMCNLLQLEDRTARGLGVNVNRNRILISIVAVVLASISTAVVGPISFLGLIVPHIGRILVGSDHKVLVPYTMLLGACVFLLADTIGRTIMAPTEISAAIIMSVIGGPFFIFLLRRSKNYAQ